MAMNSVFFYQQCFDSLCLVCASCFFYQDLVIQSVDCKLDAQLWLETVDICVVCGFGLLVFNGLKADEAIDSNVIFES
jgi:hypothetical protein